jgi:hypothetical protein
MSLAKLHGYGRIQPPALTQGSFSVASSYYLLFLKQLAVGMETRTFKGLDSKLGRYFGPEGWMREVRWLESVD